MRSQDMPRQRKQSYDELLESDVKSAYCENCNSLQRQMRLLTSEIAQLKSSLHISQLTVSQLKQELNQRNQTLTHQQNMIEELQRDTKLTHNYSSALIQNRRQSPSHQQQEHMTEKAYINSGIKQYKSHINLDQMSSQSDSYIDRMLSSKQQPSMYDKEQSKNLGGKPLIPKSNRVRQVSEEYQ